MRKSLKKYWASHRVFEQNNTKSQILNYMMELETQRTWEPISNYLYKTYSTLTKHSQCRDDEVNLIKFSWSTQYHRWKYTIWDGRQYWSSNYENDSWQDLGKIWSKTNNLKEFEKTLNVKNWYKGTYMTYRKYRQK